MHALLFVFNCETRSRNQKTVQTPSFFGTALGPRFRMENLLDPLRPLRPLPGRSQPGQRRRPRQPWNVTEALRLAQHAGTSQLRLGRCEMWSGVTWCHLFRWVVTRCEMLWHVVRCWMLWPWSEGCLKRKWWNVVKCGEMLAGLEPGLTKSAKGVDPQLTWKNVCEKTIYQNASQGAWRRWYRSSHRTLQSVPWQPCQRLCKPWWCYHSHGYHTGVTELVWHPATFQSPSAVGNGPIIPLHPAPWGVAIWGLSPRSPREKWSVCHDWLCLNALKMNMCIYDYMKIIYDDYICVYTACSAAYSLQ